MSADAELGSFWAGTPRVPNMRVRVAGGPEREFDADEQELGIIFKIENDQGGGKDSKLYHFMWLRDKFTSEVPSSYFDSPLAPRDVRTWAAIRCVGRAQHAASELLPPPTESNYALQFDADAARCFNIKDATDLWKVAADKASALKRKRRMTRALSSQYPQTKRRQKALPLEQEAASKAATIGNGVEVRPSTVGLAHDNFGLFASREFHSAELVTMYDGNRLEGGYAEACTLESQTHVAAAAGVYWDGFALANLYRTAPKLLQGRGGGAFANHDKERCKVEVWLSADADSSYNRIYLRVKHGHHINKGDEIFHDYGTGYPVAMGWDRFGGSSGQLHSSGDSAAAVCERDELVWSRGQVLVRQGAATPAPEPVPCAVRAAAFRAIQAVLQAARAAQPLATQLALPAPSGPLRLADLAEGHVVETEKASGVWSAARVVRTQQKAARPVVTAEYMYCLAPARVWMRVAHEDEVMGALLARYYPARVLSRVLPAILELHAGIGARKTDRLRAGTEVLLPEIHMAKEDERPSQIARRFGCGVEQLLKLNGPLHGGMPGLQASSKLRRNTPVLLPPCWRPGAPRPDQPPWATPPPPMHELKVGDKVYVKCAPVPGSTDMQSDVWRPATLTYVEPPRCSSHDRCSAPYLAEIDGDLAWREELNWDRQADEPKVVEQEGLEWVRATPSVAPRSMIPGELIPPWAERRPRERLLVKYPPRAPPPPLEGDQAVSWFEGLDVNDKCEVFFEQGWQAARVDAKAPDGALFVRVLRLVDDMVGKYWTIKCNLSNLRPRTAGVIADGDSDDEEEEAVATAAGGVMDGLFTSEDENEDSMARLVDDDEEEEHMQEEEDNEDDDKQDDDDEGSEGVEGQDEEEGGADARGDGMGMEFDDSEGGEEGEGNPQAASLMECAVESMDLNVEDIRNIAAICDDHAYVPYLESTCKFKSTALGEMLQAEREAAKALLIKHVPPPDARLISGFLSAHFSRADPFINFRNVEAALQKTTDDGGLSGSKMMEHLQLATLTQGSFGVVAAALIKMVPKGRKVRAVAAERLSSAESSFLTCEVLFAAVDEQFEKQGVDTRLMMELANLCHSERYEVEHMLVFDRRVDERREGVVSTLRRNLAGDDMAECVDFAALEMALGVSSLPEALLLPWPPNQVHAYIFNPRRLRAQRKQPVPRTPAETAAGAGVLAGSSSGGGSGSGTPRKLTGYEACMGSGRLSKALARKGWEMTGIEYEVEAPEYDGELLVHPAQGSGRIKLKVKSLRDIPVSEFPTVDYMHFSLDCTSVSNASGGKHGRTEASLFLGSTLESQEYNQDLMHAFLIIKDQLARPGNAAFKFTLEAPRGVARKVPHYKYLIEGAICDGFLGAKRLLVDFCKYGEEYQKRTFIWTNVQHLIDEFADATKQYPEGHPSLCEKKFCCKNGWPGKESSTHQRICEDIRTEQATPFPMEFSMVMASKIDAECACRRWECQ